MEAIESGEETRGTTIDGAAIVNVAVAVVVVVVATVQVVVQIVRCQCQTNHLGGWARSRPG